MLKLNSNYSDYTDETDVNYPEGKAVNASTSESYDGTPLLAEFMNDVNAAHIAMYEKAYGSRDGINGHADTQKASQFADAVAKYTDDKVKAHADKRGLTDGVHGATSEATPGQIISRDEYGCAKVSAPMAEEDIARKKEVDDVANSTVSNIIYNNELKKIQKTIAEEVSDVVSVSQLKEAMNLDDDIVDVVEEKNMSAVTSNAVYAYMMASVPPGTVLDYAGVVIPGGFLPCDGRAVLKTAYPSLYKALCNEKGVCIYGENQINNTFNLPDYRECATVGIGTRESGVAVHDTYTLGQFKDDQFKSHNHDASITGGEHSHKVRTGVDGPYLPVVSPGGKAYFAMNSFEPSKVEGHKHDISIDNRGGETTHGKQVGVNKIIKY